MQNECSFTQWIKFDELYEYNDKAKSRQAMFVPKNDLKTTVQAGIYLIADESIGSLDTPNSVIYIGKAVGEKSWLSFHERLWKHCCKAIGECGGRYERKDGKLIKNHDDKSEPRDTKNWANYRINQFKGFSHWYFSFFRLDEPDFEVAKKKIDHIENIVMYAYSYSLNPSLPCCNGSLPGKTVKFPWQ